jgi:iron complex transport system ATP-binding protein
MIEIRDLSLKLNINSQPVLKNICWKINKGERWVLFGRNGSGKTKLLEVITGYMRPSSGSITRFGKGEIGTDIRELRKRIGYLSSPVKELVHKNEKAVELIASGYYASAGLYTQAAKDELETAAQLLHKIGLSGREDDTIMHFSDGEKQKIFLARAMIHQPDLLILDEPCAGLDIAAREELLSTIDIFLSSETGSKTTLIFVTHHVEEITPIFTNVLMIKNGENFFNGTVNSAFTTEHLSSLFGIGINISFANNRYHSSLQ